MTDKYKEALLAVLEAKKNKAQELDKPRRDIFKGKGSKRAGIKKLKKGGVFDK